jgi:GAF domain-containing protein
MNLPNASLLTGCARPPNCRLTRKQKEYALRKSQERLAMDLADTKQLQAVSAQLIQEDKIEAMYEQLLNAASAIMHSDVATMQVLMPERNELLLFAYKGIPPDVAKFWQHVKMGAESTCGTALKENRRIVIPDIETSDIVKSEEHRAAHRLAGIRAAQSTPLLTRSGHIVGMISTHWSRVHEPSERELRLLDLLARQAADLLERKQKEDALRKSQERLAIDLADTKKLQLVSSQLIQEDNIEAIYQEILQAATAIMHTEMGS